jgi:protein tyrosine phosphatase (PTP) superfamily phosphohydrolase (DUF442 family)
MGRYTSRRTVLSLVLAAGSLPAFFACSSQEEVAVGEPDLQQAEAAAAAEAPSNTGAVGIGEVAPGLHNVFAVSPGVFSGSGPESEEAFAWLAAMGVRTVVSVDGARPDLELAHAHGMRYVHVPIGYDGMGPEQALALAKALESMPGPVYVHCHHGKHRGPTAAAVALVGLGRMTNAEAAQFMQAAGTAESYPGLWACAREQRVFSEGELALAPAELPEVRVVSGLVEGMVTIDKTWDRMKLVREAGWAAPPDHPDVAPAAEAGILADHFRALADDEETRLEGEELVAAMRGAMELASALEATLAAGAVDASAAEGAYKAVAASCKDCHTRWRD